jgi:hypothetical protein
MNADDGKAGPWPCRRARAGLLAVILAGATLLLAAGCSGGPAQSDQGNGSSPFTVQKMDSFAACMRGHGIPNFYFSARNNTPNPNSNAVVLSIGGYQVTGVNPQTTQFQSAMKTCRHILGIHPPSQAVQHKQFELALRQAACMRTHGYPGWQDPSQGPNGQGLFDPGPPAGVDTSSPQFLKAEKACGM